MIVFFSFFLLMGSLVFYFLALVPLMNARAARSWPTAEATVLSSELKQFSGEDGYTYRPEIEYRYEVGGVQYESNQYRFTQVATGDRDAQMSVVEFYAPGTKTTCFYDPDDPSNAVLDRNLGWVILFGLIPLVFILIGGGGILYAVFKPSARSQNKRMMLDETGVGAAYGDRYDSGGVGADYGDRYDSGGVGADYGARYDSAGVSGPGVREPAVSAMENNEYVPTGPMLLESSQSPLSKFLGLLFIGVFWNGIVSVFVYAAVQSFRDGDTQWFLVLFLIPFVLIGLLLIFGAVQSFLQIFNPRPRLIVENGRDLVLGRTVQVRWEMDGKVSSIRQLEIKLIGEERATYTRGTNTHTDEEVFYDQTLFTSSNPHEISAGNLHLPLPADSMHSFFGGYNEIVWSLQVKGDIAFWPDVDEKYSIHVRPHPVK